MSNDFQPSDSDELLSTKLTTPYLSAALVARQPLLARLDAGLTHKLTLISAPAGFGKTTLVSEWVEKVRRSDHQALFAWISLDPSDDDPVRFWRYVLSASQAFSEDIGKSALAILNHNPQPAFEALLTGFINQVALLHNRSVLVLDDYHVITARLIHGTMAFFLEHLPPGVHVILNTRQ